MNAQDIALTIHAHPTLAESVMDTAEAALAYLFICKNFIKKDLI